MQFYIFNKNRVFMKKIFLLYLSFTILLPACNHTSREAEEHADHVHSEISELGLNNGAKWKSDASTNENVQNLKTIADNFQKKPSPSINDYQLLSADLKNGLDKMIKECKMSGPDHDALHKWLHPFLQENDELKNVKDTVSGRSAFISINKQLDNYYNYFE